MPTFFDALTNIHSTDSVNEIVANINTAIQPYVIEGSEVAVSAPAIRNVAKAIVREVLRQVESNFETVMFFISIDGAFEFSMDDCFAGFAAEWDAATAAIVNAIVGVGVAVSDDCFGGTPNFEFAASETLRNALSLAFEGTTAIARDQRDEDELSTVWEASPMLEAA